MCQVHDGESSQLGTPESGEFRVQPAVRSKRPSSWPLFAALLLSSDSAFYGRGAFPHHSEAQLHRRAAALRLSSPGTLLAARHAVRHPTLHLRPPREPSHVQFIW